MTLEMRGICKSFGSNDVLKHVDFSIQGGEICALRWANVDLNRRTVRITSAIGDMAEPALTVAADGGITAPEAVRTKLELGDGYGMRGASALGKEWYEHSAGYCSYLKGKTEAEAASIPADGSDPDLAALCTISIDALQKAAGDAFENASL